VTTLNNIRSINDIKSFSYAVKSPQFRINGLKTGVFKINGIKIKIDSKDSLETIAKKINAKKKYTQIEARIIKCGSEYRLILCSKKQKVDIIDYDIVLLNLYKKKLLGINDKCLIQIVRKRTGYESNDIIINYKHIKESILNNQILDESSKLILSTFKSIIPLVSHNKVWNQEQIPANNFNEIPPEILENVQPVEIIVIPFINNTVQISKAVFHITNEIKSPSLSESSLPEIVYLATPKNNTEQITTENLNKPRIPTPTWKKGERIIRFNKVINYVFTHTSDNERREFGLMVEKEKIKYKSEEDLNIVGKKLTQSEKITKKLYEIYNLLKKSKA